MSNSRLDFLLRKSKGKGRLSSYLQLFLKIGFQNDELQLVELIESDVLVAEMKIVLLNSSREIEFISGEDTFIESDLLREKYLAFEPNSKCYLFTGDYLYCGMFLCKATTAFERALLLAKEDNQNTCFILDYESKYFFTVNYYDSDNLEHPNIFDIQRSIPVSSENISSKIIG